MWKNKKIGRYKSRGEEYPEIKLHKFQFQDNIGDIVYLEPCEFGFIGVFNNDKSIKKIEVKKISDSEYSFKIIRK